MQAHQVTQVVDQQQAAAAMDPETYTAEAERRIALAMDWDGDVEDYARA